MITSHGPHFFAALSLSAVLGWAVTASAENSAPPEEAPQERPAETTTVSPIPADWAAVFDAMRPDPAPEKLIRNTHYFTSNENALDLFHAAIVDKGGVFIGLGAEQNYLMAGWARPQILVPFDFDKVIIDLHAVYRVAFLHARTPKEFIAFWAERNAKTTRQLIKEAHPEPARRKAVLKAFRLGREFVHKRLIRTKRMYRNRKAPTFLNDPEQYQFIVDLFKADRVYPICGDLTADIALRDVAEATRKAGLTVRVLYLSNAEQYFKYKSDFKENIYALPFDDRALVLRTVGMKTEWSPDGMYEYVIQGGDNFQAWLRSEFGFSVWSVISSRKVNRRTGRSEITKLPPKKKQDK